VQRRYFCKLMAAAAAARAVPTIGQTDDAAQSAAFHALNNSTEDYAAYCAAPADQRVFYAYEGGKFIQEKLDQKTWTPTGWGKPPNLPIPGGSWDGVPMISPIPNLAGEGPYKPTWDSLLQYDAPEWYRDAKFGIWAHWTPQCVPEDGDWYARNMYMQGSKQNEFQVQHYGPPSTFGYKDLCPQWTLLNWEPDALIERFKKAGARFFLTVANHHDGFDTWDSKHQPWNAASIGPRRDVVGPGRQLRASRDFVSASLCTRPAIGGGFRPHTAPTKPDRSQAFPMTAILTAAEGKNQWWQGLDPQRLYGAKHPLNAFA